MDILYGIYVEGGSYSDCWWEQLCVVTTKEQAEVICNEANKIVSEYGEALTAWNASHQHLYNNWKPLPHVILRHLDKKMIREGRASEFAKMEQENKEVMDFNLKNQHIRQEKLNLLKKTFTQRLEGLLPGVDHDSFCDDARYSYQELPWLSEVKIPTKQQ